MGARGSEELRYQVTYHMYLSSKGPLSYTPGIELNNTRKFSFFIFSVCRLRHVHMRKHTRLSPLFRTASNKNLRLGKGLGNEATGILHLAQAG